MEHAWRLEEATVGRSFASKSVVPQVFRDSRLRFHLALYALSQPIESTSFKRDSFWTTQSLKSLLIAYQPRVSHYPRQTSLARIWGIPRHLNHTEPFTKNYPLIAAIDRKSRVGTASHTTRVSPRHYSLESRCLKPRPWLPLGYGWGYLVARHLPFLLITSHFADHHGCQRRNCTPESHPDTASIPTSGDTIDPASYSTSHPAGYSAR